VYFLGEAWDWHILLNPYEQAVNELRVKIESYIKEFELIDQLSPIERVEGRVKRVGSILDKANRKNIPLTNFYEMAELIEDIAGVRVICRFVEDIEKVVLLLRKRNDLKILTERDYITKRKPSGYRSYHIHIRYPVTTMKGNTEVLAELQIRTMAMNYWAAIEHTLKYKYNGNIPDDVHKRLVKSAEAAFALDHEMGVIRGEIVEAHRAVEQKNDIVDKILHNMKNLFTYARLEKVDELNKEFISINEEGSLEKLNAFNQQLRMMAQLYKVDYF